jgi:hypothetical protein
MFTSRELAEESAFPIRDANMCQVHIEAMETYKPSYASPRHNLPRLFPSIESTEKQMHDWRRVGKPALPLDDIFSEGPISRAISVKSWEPALASRAGSCLSKRFVWHFQSRRNDRQRPPTACIWIWGVPLAAANLAHLVLTSPAHSVVSAQGEKFGQTWTAATNRSTVRSIEHMRSSHMDLLLNKKREESKRSLICL